MSGFSAHMPDLLATIAEASIESDRWPAVMDMLADSLGGAAILFQQSADNSGVTPFYSARFAESDLESYASYYVSTNVWTAGLSSLPAGSIASGNDLLPKAEFERSEYYSDWLRPQGLYQGIGAILEHSNKRMTQLSVIRPYGASDYNQRERDDWRAIGAHVRRALQINRTLGFVKMERDAALSGLDRLGTGILVLDAKLRILFADHLALSLLEKNEGLTASGGGLITTSPHLAALEALVHQVCSTVQSPRPHPGGGVALPRTDKRPLWALVCPYSAEAEAALVLIRDLDCSRPTASLALQQLFGLTPTEALLAASLADGKSLSDIADERKITLNTLRTQLKSIMGKTGTNRQSELLVLILRSVAMMEERGSSIFGKRAGN